MKTDGTNLPSAQTEKKGTLGEWLKERKDSFLSAIPKGTVEIDRFMQSAFLAITNPKQKNLVLCDKDSIFRSLREAASYGLELNGTLGQAYLIPYNESVNVGGKWEKKMICHFQMGYKGLIALARRSSTIKTIAAEPVYENDIFEVQLGVGRNLSHRMDLKKERGEIIGYYCLVELENGGVQFKVMSRKDVELHRDKFSKAYNKDDKENIWNKNFDAMALKTCVIQALKLCPISIEALDAVEREEKEDLKDATVLTESEYNIADSVDDAEVVETKKITVENQPESLPQQQMLSPDEEMAVSQAFDNASVF